MSDVKRLSVNILSRVIPCIHIDDDGQSLTLTSLTIQKREETKDDDTFLTSEQFLSLVSQPAEKNANLNDTDYISYYESCDNLLINYKDFPGVIREIFEKFDAVLKIRMKMTFKFVGPVSKEYNWVGFMHYFFQDNIFSSLTNEPSNMIMGSMKLLNFSNVELKVAEGAYPLFPSVIIKIPGNNQIPNLNECDLVVFHSDPGYYCNLQLGQISYKEFRETNYSDIVIDTEVLELLKKAELKFEKKHSIAQNTASTILGSPST
jgi:hypothetical protein